jgi:hypothetical protein
VIKAKDSRGIERLVSGRQDGELVAEICFEYVILRPKGSWHDGDSQVTVSWQTIYRNGLLTRSLKRRAK